jgi:hypothetical protein
MIRLRKTRLLLAVSCMGLIACTPPAADRSTSAAAPTRSEAGNNAELLDFSIREGKIYNRFFRRGPVSAHTVLTSGSTARLLVAFPAGNSGVSLWFKKAESEVRWSDVESIRDVQQANRDGETLFGVESVIAADARQLSVDKAVLGSIRVIRDYMHNRQLAAALESEVTIAARTATWYRDRLDGQGGYELSIEVLQGSIAGSPDGTVVFKAQAGQPLRLRVLALSGEEPLTPIGMDELLSEDAVPDPLAKQVLAFLSYREKLLAGSWRFCTYFGRDTLLSIRLLLPVLGPVAIESGIGSVLARLNAEGEVAHEEDIGEFAILRRASEGLAVSDEPLYDYHMIDDDFMLAPIAASYFLDHPEGRTRAAAFLRRNTPRGQTYGDALVDNLRFVLASAEPFGHEPEISHLIRLKDGVPAGDWRDSSEGLGNGRIPYDVNAVFVPAALAAIARLQDSGLLQEFMHSGVSFSQASSLAETWSNHAPPLFVVHVPLDRARRHVADYASANGLPEHDALASLQRSTVVDDFGLTFNAVALDDDGRTIPILNSDDGFALMFGNPPTAELERMATVLLRPFPAGLLTPAGLVVANPAYASGKLQQLFTGNHYHGTVVWSWQQALLAAGLERQLQRGDLSAATRQHLSEARVSLWQVITATNAVRNSELWSWSIEHGKYRVEPFGQRSSDETESNAAQLWSTVYLAIPVP